MATQAELKAKLDAVAANVADEDTVISSVETLLTNLGTLITDLRNQLANAAVPQALLDQADAIATVVTNQKAKLAADVVANTPAAP